MVSTPMFHHLLLFALLWLCFLLHVLWPYGQLPVYATPPQPTPSRRKRSREGSERQVMLAGVGGSATH